MSDKEKDIDEGIDFSEEGFNKRFKRVSRPKFLDKIPKNTTLRDCKSRITIYLDADIIEFFKQEAEKTNEGYQTLINRALRSITDSQSVLSKEFKESLLKDKEFLSELKTALAI
ncbi:hypothetical protein BH24ACI2_BH24ACI2_01190 [soil metagenome]|jgi:uncharacterized protein (DUF4415 family)|nr:BrnA antitoxin family protein [Acidobacteriota bacterium]